MIDGTERKSLAQVLSACLYDFQPGMSLTTLPPDSPAPGGICNGTGGYPQSPQVEPRTQFLIIRVHSPLF